MPILRLDYQRNQKPVQAAGVAVLAAAVVGLAAGGLYYQSLMEATGEWDARAQAVERSAPGRQTAAGPVDEKAMRAMAQEITQANQVLRELSIPWDKLFHAIEDSAGKDVTLLSMEPDATKRIAKIAGEARNLAAVLDYVRHLEQQAVLRDVYLQRHEIEQQDPEKPIHFNVMARWEMTP